MTSKACIMSLAVLALPATALADDPMAEPVADPAPATEISIGYGAFPASNFIATYRDHYNLKNSWGSVSATFNRRLSVPLSIGIGYTFSSSPGLEHRPADGSDIDAQWHTLLVNARYTLWHRGRMAVYSSVAAGVTIGYMSPSWRDSYNITRFAFQVNPIGIEWEFTPSLGAYFEAGMGMQGILGAGLRLHL